MQLILRVANLDESKEIKNIHLSSERVPSTSVFQDFNTIFKLFSFTLELQDVDSIPLNGVLELNLGSTLRKMEFTVLKFSKIKTVNKTDDINNIVVSYKVIGIGIPFHMISKAFNKRKGTLDDPFALLQEYFDKIEIDSFRFSNTNFYNANLFQILHKIRDNIYFNESDLTVTPVILVDDDFTSIKIKNFFDLDMNKVFVSGSIEAGTVDEFNLYKSFNVNKSTSKTVFNQKDNALIPVKINMDNGNNLDNQYFEEPKDVFVDNTIISALKGNSSSNLLDLYENSTTKMLNVVDENLLKNLYLGNDLVFTEETFKLIGFNITLSYDVDVIGGMFQLTKI